MSDLINKLHPVDLGIFIISVFVITIVVATIRKLTRAFLKSQEAKELPIHQLLKTINDSTRTLFIISSAIWITSHFLDLPEKLQSTVNVTFLIISCLQIGLWINEISKLVIYKVFRYRAEKNNLSTDDQSSYTGKNIIEIIATFIVWAVIILFTLDHIGFNITSLVAGLGIGGIAIGLALQNILADLFSSLSIIFDKPFERGDFIVCDEFMGNIESIGLKTTRIRSLSGELIIFPNQHLVEGRIRNYKQMQKRRICTTLGVTYETPSEKLEQIPQIIEKCIDPITDVTFDRCHFASYGDFSLNFEIVYHVMSPDYTKFMDIQQEINLKIFKAFTEAEIDFAYPTQQLYLTQQPTKSLAK